jgi:hypothetical protein
MNYEEQLYEQIRTKSVVSTEAYKCRCNLHRHALTAGIWQINCCTAQNMLPAAEIMRSELCTVAQQLDFQRTKSSRAIHTAAGMQCHLAAAIA